MRRLPLILVLLLSLCAIFWIWNRRTGAISGLFETKTKNTDDSDESQGETSANQVARVVAQGRIEPAGGVIGIFASPGDRVESFEALVEEGASVEEGQSLGRLASHKAHSYELAVLSARLAEARESVDAGNVAKQADLLVAQKAVAQVTAASEQIEAREQQVALLQRAFEQLTSEHARMKRISARSDLVSANALSRSKLALEKARTEWKSATIQLASEEQSSKAQLAAAEAKEQSVGAQYDQAIALVPLRSVEIQLEALEDKVDEATLPAPKSGTILKIYSRPGETIGRKPILQLADLSQMICVAEVFENYVNSIRPGQEVLIRSPIFGNSGTIRGTVQSIGRMILAAELKELDPFSKSDVRVVEVTIAIHPGEDTELAARLVHLQVEVEIQLGSPTAESSDQERDDP